MNRTNDAAPEANMKISYLYRDADNYKVYNECIIPGTLTKTQQETILNCLDEETYFIPNLVGLPEKRFEVFDPAVDHPWFELDEDSFEETTAQPNVFVTADELVASFCRCKGCWMDLYQNEPAPQVQASSPATQSKSVRTIQTIETERYEEQANHLLKYVGMITGREAFEQLKNHLSEVGLLPDEYFSPSFQLNMEEELPEYITAICHVDWGGSEGIYADISLLTRDPISREQKLIPFATGKTLDSGGDSFLHMSRIAAECSMMLNGRGCLVKVSNRYYGHETPDLASKIETAKTIAASKTPHHPDLQPQAER